MAASFNIVSGTTGTDRKTWSIVADGFADGKSAAQWVADRKSAYAFNGKSLAIVKGADSSLASAPSIDWRAREAERLASGHYAPLPAPWHDLIAARNPDHFAHVATSHKHKVAFTERATSGEAYKQKVITATLYAERHLQGLDASERGDFVAAMTGQTIPVLFAPLGDADALESLYRECNNGRGTSSCMTESESRYSSPFHPVRIYAMGGDITLAWLRENEDSDDESTYSADLDSSGDIVARALVWPEKLIYGRVYGDCDGSNALRNGLEAQGFKAGSFNGARLGRYEHHDSFVMPYLDGDDQSASEGRGDFLVIGGGTYNATNTNGLSDRSERYTCEHCGEGYNGEFEGSSVRVSSNQYSEEFWCDYCEENHSFHCEHLHENVSNSCHAEYIPSGASESVSVADWLLEDGTILNVICDDGERREDAFICDDCGEGFPDDQCNTASNGDSCCGACASDAESFSDCIVIAIPSAGRGREEHPNQIELPLPHGCNLNLASNYPCASDAERMAA
jgi:hypothetical protein